MDFFDKFMELFLPVSNKNAITVNIQGDGFPVGTLEFYPNKGGSSYCRYTPHDNTSQKWLTVGDTLTLNVRKASS